MSKAQKSRKGYGQITTTSDEGSRRKNASTEPNLRFASQPSIGNKKKGKNSKIKEQLFRALSSINKEINMSIDSKEKLKGTLPSLDFFINKPSNSSSNLKSASSSVGVSRKNSKLVEINMNFLNNISSISSKALNKEKFSKKFVNQKAKKEKNNGTEMPIDINPMNVIISKMQSIDNDSIIVENIRKDLQDTVNVLSNNNCLKYTKIDKGKIEIKEMNIKTIMSFYDKKTFELSQYKNDMMKNKEVYDKKEKELGELKAKIKELDDIFNEKKKEMKEITLDSEERNNQRDLSMANKLIKEENEKLKQEISNKKKRKDELIKKYSLDIKEYLSLINKLKLMQKIK